jgi:hypothetical protein
LVYILYTTVLALAGEYVLRSVSLQVKFTAIAVNLKRIARIVSSSNDYIFSIFRLIPVNVKVIKIFMTEMPVWTAKLS